MSFELIAEFDIFLAKYISNYASKSEFPTSYLSFGRFKETA